MSTINYYPLTTYYTLLITLINPNYFNCILQLLLQNAKGLLIFKPLFAKTLPASYVYQPKQIKFVL